MYLEPIFAIVGGLHRIGLSLPLAYQLFKPVAIIALLLAAVAWARRLFADQLGARAATVTLSLFLYTPLAALYSWTQMGAGSFRFSLYLLADELLGASKLWGYVPSAIGLALVPTALLATERSLTPSPGTSGTRPMVVAAVAALVACWLHPWQGITLVVIFIGLTILQRGRQWFALAVPAVAAALPLGYYYLLSHSDPAWKLASHYEVIARLPAVVLLAGLGPLALVAALGVRRPRGVVIEQALLLWIAACLITYFVNDSFAPHALQGLSFPLAVLMVRGVQRLALPRAAAIPLGIVGVGLLTIPGLAYDARKFVNTARNQRLVQYYLPEPDARALDWVSHRGPPGGVLAPTPFATVIPAETGRAVWVGHGYWSRDYPDRAKRVDRLFTGHMTAAVAPDVRGRDRSLVADRRLQAPGGRSRPSAGPADRRRASLRLRPRVRPADRSARAVRQAVDEPQPRPGGVDRTHLVVDQPHPQAQLANGPVGEIGLHAGTALRPRDPQSARRIKGRPPFRQAPLQLPAARAERDDHVGGTRRRAVVQSRARRQLAEYPVKPLGGGHQQDPRVRLDPQLAHQWGAGVAGVRAHSPASSATSAISRESWLPCHAIGERPGSSVTSRAPGIASA